MCFSAQKQKQNALRVNCERRRRCARGGVDRVGTRARNVGRRLPHGPGSNAGNHTATSPIYAQAKRGPTRGPLSSPKQQSPIDARAGAHGRAQRHRQGRANPRKIGPPVAHLWQPRPNGRTGQLHPPTQPHPLAWGRQLGQCCRRTHNTAKSAGMSGSHITSTQYNSNPKVNDKKQNKTKSVHVISPAGRKREESRCDSGEIIDLR